MSTQQAVSKWDKPFMYIDQVADELNMSVWAVRRMLDFNTKAHRPSDKSQFPNAFKEGPGPTQRIRIPVDDVEDYKRRMAEGIPYPQTN